MSASNLSLKMIVLSLGLATALSGCGTKGPLAPAETAVPASKPAKADQGLGDIPTMGQKKTETKPVETPNQPFFLDFLL